MAGRQGAKRPPRPKIERVRLTEEEIKERYGREIEEAMLGFLLDPSYLIEMAEQGRKASEGYRRGHRLAKIPEIKVPDGWAAGLVSLRSS